MSHQAALKAWCLGSLLAVAGIQALAGATDLQARYGQLRDELRSNSFQRPLYIDSAETGDTLKGDVYAVLDHPFARLRDALREPAAWCDILILPFNTKYCHAAQTAAGPALLVRIGRKYDQPVEKAYKLTFAYRNLASGTDYLETRLDAKEGPLGTRDYRIAVAAVPLENGRTFMHLSYAYGYGMAGRMAMQAYLATVGADKVGFTVTGRDGSGRPQHIRGVRGAVERNAMRYYLAIDAYLDSLAAPPARRLEQRIQNWFAATDRYPLQLREMDWNAYAAMKRQEYERQQTMIQ